MNRALNPNQSTTANPPDWASKAPIKLCERFYSGVMEREGQEVVVLSKVGLGFHRPVPCQS
jgi:hypothetical protein